MQEDPAWQRTFLASQFMADGAKMDQEALDKAMAFDVSSSCVRSMDGTIEHWSRGNSRLYGWQQTEAVGCVIHALLRAKFPEPLDRIHSYLLSKGEWGGELIHTAKSGTEMRVASQWQLLRSANGSPRAVIEVNSQIEQTGSVQRAQYLAAIVESSDDAIISKDLRGILTSWNAGAEKLFGYTAAEIVGKSVLVLFPDELIEEEKVLMSRLQQGEKIDHYETVRLTKAGKRVEVSLSISPLRNSAGVVIGAAKICRDISQRKLMERAFRESEERQRLALEAGELGLWSFDARRNTQDWSARCKAIFGLKEGAPTPEYADCLRLLHSEDRTQVDANFQECIKHGKRFELEYRVVQPSGAIRWVEAKGRPLLDEEGQVIAAHGTIADLTKRKRMEEALRATNSQLEQFAYAAAHDLQEPLRNISLSIDLARVKAPNAFDPETDELLDTAVVNARQMEEMLRNLLSYATVMDEDAEHRPTIDANEVVALALSNLEAAIRESSANVRVGQLPAVQIGKVHLLQLFQNLIGNSLKYHGPEQPSIEIDALPGQHYSKFWVRDNGIGIQPEYRDRVFGLFKRLREKEVSGTGIGLALCKKIVRHYGGEIWVDSDGTAGTTICFTVPAAVGI